MCVCLITSRGNSCSEYGPMCVCVSRGGGGGKVSYPVGTEVGHVVLVVVLNAVLFVDQINQVHSA